MPSRLGTAIGVALAAAALALPLNFAQGFERSAMPLRFKPEEESYERYMFQLVMSGAHISPGIKDELDWREFGIGTVYKDEVVDAGNQYTRHSMTFYTYNVKQLQTGLGQDRNDPRFGGSPFPDVPGDNGGGGEGGGGGGEDGGGGGEGGGDGGGGGGGDPTPTGMGGKMNSGGGNFISGLNLPPGPSTMGGGPAPLQNEGGGGGDGDGGGPGDRNGGDERAGDRTATTVNLDTIRVTNLDYIEDPSGNILDVGGLDLLRKVSQNQLVNSEDKKNFIDINISHVFEWSHMLRLPDYPVYKEDIWFAEMPIHVPGLPYDKPVLTKFMYKLIDFRTVGDRKVAVVDMTGVTEWNHEWDTTAAGTLTEFKSWGNMGFSARYWFDYETNTIFAITRPPFQDWQYQRGYPGGINFFIPYDPITGFNMTFPGLAITMEFFYNTRETDISGKPRLVEVEPKEQRRYIVLNMLCQLEAE